MPLNPIIPLINKKTRTIANIILYLLIQNFQTLILWDSITLPSTIIESRHTLFTTVSL